MEMFKPETEIPELVERHPSVYRLWVMAGEETNNEGDRMDRYYELLEEYGHR